MKKKLIALLLCGFTTFSLFGCTSTETKKPDTNAVSDAEKDNSETESPDTTANNEPSEPKGPDYESGTTPELLEGITYEVPKLWEKKISEDGKSIYYYPDITGTVPAIVMITYRSIDFSSIPADEIPAQLSQVADGLSSGEGVRDLSKEETNFSNGPAFKATYVQKVNSTDYDVISHIIPVNQTGVLIYTYGVKVNTNNTFQDDFDYIYEHITLPAAASSVGESVSDETTTASVPEGQADGNSTTEQKNALGKAKSYLSFSSFSHDGLIEQLEYEGFSTENATYAADNCGADWNAQALKKAQSYLDTSSFSYSGLIEQLEYEGFSAEQATYAVDNCGADWSEQAEKKAQSYMDMSSFSRENLIEQLEYEGFSTEQAEYGASAVGY